MEATSLELAILASDTALGLEAIKHDEIGWVGLPVSLMRVRSLRKRMRFWKIMRRARLGKAAREFVLKPYELKTQCLPKQLDWVF